MLTTKEMQALDGLYKVAPVFVWGPLRMGTHDQVHSQVMTS